MDRLNRAMVAAGVDQSELARRLRITPSAVQQWTVGKTQPSGKRLAEVAKALGVAPADLINPEALLRQPEPLSGLDSAGLPDERAEDINEVFLLTIWRIFDDRQKRAALAQFRAILRGNHFPATHDSASKNNTTPEGSA